MKIPMGQYCKIYGNTIQNRIIEYFLEFNGKDVAVGDMAKELSISKPKAYEIIEEFLKKEYIVKERIIGRTQLYKLNKNNTIVKLFIRNFDECLQMVIEENSKKNRNIINAKILVTTKNI